MKRRKWIPVCAALLFGCCLALGPGAKAPGAQVEAKSKVVKKDRTPKEPGSSDLKVVQTVTKLSGKSTRARTDRAQAARRSSRYS